MSSFDIKTAQSLYKKQQKEVKKQQQAKIANRTIETALNDSPMRWKSGKYAKYNGQASLMTIFNEDPGYACFYVKKCNASTRAGGEYTVSGDMAYLEVELAKHFPSAF